MVSFVVLRTALPLTRRRTGSRPARVLLALGSLLVALLVSAGPVLAGACDAAFGAGRDSTQLAPHTAPVVHPPAHDHGAASHRHDMPAGEHAGDHHREPGPDGGSCSAAMICGAIALTVAPPAPFDARAPRTAPSGTGVALVSTTRTPEPPPPRG